MYVQTFGPSMAVPSGLFGGLARPQANFDAVPGLLTKGNGRHGKPNGRRFKKKRKARPRKPKGKARSLGKHAGSSKTH